MSELNRKELKQNINKGNFDRFYLIFGEEKMYVKADCDYLVEKVAGKQPSEFNYHSFTKDYNLDDIAVAVQVVPFMSEYNVVKISDYDASGEPKADVDRLLAIFDNVPDTTIVILAYPTLEQDPKKLGTNFKSVFNYIKKRGTVCQTNRETDISLARQIVRWADKRGIKIEQADAYKLQEYVGDDLYTIKNELDKLCNYVGDGGLITGREIELLVTKRLEANIFKLTDEIVAQNSSKAFEILDILFYQKADVNEIISVISMAYMDFYRARVATECGAQLSAVAKDFGYGRREFALKNAVKKTRSIPTEALRDSLDEITQAVSKLRSSSTNDRILLETLVAKLIMLAGRRDQ